MVKGTTQERTVVAARSFVIWGEELSNIEWVKASLSKSSPRLKVFDVAESDRAEEEESDVAAKGGGGDLVVDWNVKG